MRRWGNSVPVVVIVAIAAGCSGGQDVPSPAAPGPARPSAPAAPPAVQAPDEPNLLSFASGTMLVATPAEYRSSWPVRGILDDRSNTGWASPEGKLAGHVFVVELPERTEFKTLSFDTAGADGAGRGAREVLVEISDTSADGGFKPIAEVSLKDKEDNQRTPAAPEPGRWVRLTVKSNNGAPDYAELMEVRGFGRQLTTTPFPQVSGTYATNYGDFHIKQEGTSIVGCYELSEGVLAGGIEGRTMKLLWREGASAESQGPALMVFSADAKRMFGLWWRKGSETQMGNAWDGERKSDTVGSCPHMPALDTGNAAKDRMTKDLATDGRTRVYGINFDFGSDVVRSESKGTLDQIVAVLKEHAAWTMTVEGHTDSAGGEPANQKLSERRAEAVRLHLVTGGIEPARLAAAGFGMSKPVASNTDAIGRAQNRRVELVRR